MYEPACHSSYTLSIPCKPANPNKPIRYVSVINKLSLNPADIKSRNRNQLLTTRSHRTFCRCSSLMYMILSSSVKYRSHIICEDWLVAHVKDCSSPRTTALKAMHVASMKMMIEVFPDARITRRTIDWPQRAPTAANVVRNIAAMHMVKSCQYICPQNLATTDRFYHRRPKVMAHRACN